MISEKKGQITSADNHYVNLAYEGMMAQLGMTEKRLVAIKH
jgi:hypothetical protein